MKKYDWCGDIGSYYFKEVGGRKFIAEGFDPDDAETNCDELIEHRAAFEGRKQKERYGLWS